MFQRILVPLDGSPFAEQALPIATQVARAWGGRIILLHVVDAARAYVSYGAFQPLLAQDVIDKSLSSAKRYLDGLQVRNQLTRLPVEKQAILGNPAVAILSTIERHFIDLVIMCSHGHSGVKHWILGSTAEKVVHHASVPVLLQRQWKLLKSHPQSDGTPCVRALVPLDTSARAQDAIAPAASLVAAVAHPGQGELHFTQILTLPLDIDEQKKESLLQEVGQSLQALCESTRQSLITNLEAGFRVKLTWSITLDSDIADGIVHVAEHGSSGADGSPVEPCDLIAMTTHGYTGLQKWTMGSIADRVLYTTRLPLLLTRPADMILKEYEDHHSQVEAGR